MKRIERQKYLDELISLKENGMIKVITGMRRCGKSYLLFEIFSSYLESSGVKEDHIIKIDLEDYKNKLLRNPDNIYEYVESRIVDSDIYYILLDEVQMLDDFVDVLNGFLKKQNVDIYVTGSNAKFLSKDVITEFRGRGFEIRVYPLSFSEYMSEYQGSLQSGINEYMLYGGLPQILSYKTDEHKTLFLKSLFEETYIKDIKERYNIRKDDDLEELINTLASGDRLLLGEHKLRGGGLPLSPRRVPRPDENGAACDHGRRPAQPLPRGGLGYHPAPSRRPGGGFGSCKSAVRCILDLGASSFSPVAHAGHVGVGLLYPCAGRRAGR